MEHYDLVIVGTGSGNSVPTPEMDDWRIAIVEKGVFGGTCLNVGCIPSKMFVLTADVAETIRHASRYGVAAHVDGVDWPGIVQRVFGRIDPIATGGEEWRAGLENVDVYKEHGRFIDHKVLQVGDEQITADRWVLAAGARPFIPPVPGIDDVGYHTSDTIMRLPELPERLLVIGGGYIAAELGHVFGALGSEITFVIRSDRMLREQDEQVSAAATQLYAERFDLRDRSTIVRAWRDDEGVHLELEREGGTEIVTGDELLVAAGRVPNSDTLGVEATGVEVHPDGRVVTDDLLATNVEGIWAFGDLANPFQLKHLANAEARVLSHNLTHPDDLRRMDYEQIPSAVFGSPQIASVGATEQALRESGRPYLTSVTHYGGTAYGWALEDTTSFVKLIADPETRLLLGAHIIGPQASTLIQQLIQGMRFGQTVDDMAREQFYIHPALTEAVEVALLGF
ncbi:MAG: mycothione reductase [Actinomycetota bacterium]